MTAVLYSKYNFILETRAGSDPGSNSVRFDSGSPGGAPSVLVALSSISHHCGSSWNTVHLLLYTHVHKSGSASEDSIAEEDFNHRGSLHAAAARPHRGAGDEELFDSSLWFLLSCLLSAALEVSCEHRNRGWDRYSSPSPCVWAPLSRSTSKVSGKWLDVHHTHKHTLIDRGIRVNRRWPKGNDFCKDTANPNLFKFGTFFNYLFIYFFALAEYQQPFLTI